MLQFGDVSFVLGKSSQMQCIYNLIERVASSNATVLIIGETGSGKEIIARVLHYLSPHKSSPFVAVNCAALPPNLMESELFGHEKGAFTGAESTRIGRFELADKGTILLDEISEIDIRLQSKLLRVLEEKKFERVGSSFSKKVTVRVIATTNRDLVQLIEKEAFRPDLYFRLNVIPIHVPPLRERPDDIVPLLQYYVTQCCHENHLPLKSFKEDAIEELLNYHWPGNVRELFNLIERLVVISPHQEITAEDIVPWLSSNKVGQFGGPRLIGLPLESIEKETIRSNLAYFGGNRRRTAEVLRIAERTLRDKIRKYEIAAPAKFSSSGIYNLK